MRGNQSGLGKAVRYALKRSKGLSHFLTDPKIALDNNPAERALWNVVIGRKRIQQARSATRFAAPGLEVAHGFLIFTY